MKKQTCTATERIPFLAEKRNLTYKKHCVEFSQCGKVDVNIQSWPAIHHLINFPQISVKNMYKHH